MSTFQPGDETFDDVTGHKVTPTNVPDEETEGHKLPVRCALADDDAEVEGHRIQRSSEDDDSEGHRRPGVR